MPTGGAGEYGFEIVAACVAHGSDGVGIPPISATLGISPPTLMTAFLLCAGLAVLLAPIVARWFKRLPRTRSAPPTVHERAESLSRLGRDRESLEMLMKEVRELTRLCAQQLDTRAERLERLLALADDKIRRLESNPFTPHEVPLVETKAVGVPRARAAAQPAGAGRDTSEFPPDPVAQQVYELADEGRSSVEIAGALEEHVGKVELILALRGA